MITKVIAVQKQLTEQGEKNENIEEDSESTFHNLLKSCDDGLVPVEGKYSSSLSSLSAVEAKPDNESESDDESDDEFGDVTNGYNDNNGISHCNQNVNNSGHMHLSPRNATIMDRSIYNTTSNVDISTYNNRLMLRNAPVQSPLNIQNNTCMSGIITLQQQQLMNLQQPQLLNLQQPQVLNLQQQ